MGIQINGNNDTISASDGSLSVAGQQLTDVTNVNASGIITATSFSGNVTVATGATISGSTNTIVASTNGSERVRIDGNGTAYINGTTQFTSNGGLNIEQTASGSESVILGLSNQGTADGSGIIISFRGKDDAGNQNDYAYIKMVADDTGNGSEDSSLRFWTQNAGTLGEAARFTAAGNLQFPSGQGIDFSATADAAGMTGELLNDYEEGTWTPVMAFGGGSTGIAYASQTGRYTKIGRMVHATVLITLSSKGSSTGAATIGGLPFTPLAGLPGYSAAACADVGGVTFTGDFSWRITGGSTSGNLIHNGGNSLLDTAFANNFQIIASVTYTT